MNKNMILAQQAKKSLLNHFAIMFLLCAALQIIIAIRGSQIDLAAQLLLAVVAVYYAWYTFASRRVLRRVRYGRLVAHAVGYLTVNLSYHVHAFFLYINDSPAIKGSDDYFSIDGSWFGVLFGMSTAWGIGLLIHLVASVANRGFEELAKD